MTPQIAPRRIAAPLHCFWFPFSWKTGPSACWNCFSPPDQERQTRRELIRLATELVGFAAAFLHKHEWKNLKDEQQVWHELETFAAQVHRSLDPREVACLVANDGKRLVKCDQLSVAQWQGQSAEVLAISGAVTLENDGPLVRAMQALLASVGSWGEILTYQGARNESLPPKVLDALDGYLVLSNSRLLIALPLKDQHEEGDNRISGIVLAESFGGDLQAEQIRQRLDFIARHAGPALSNALAMERLPLQWLTRPLASLKSGLASNSRLRLLLFVSIMTLCSAFLVFCPLPLKSEANGELVPTERRTVYAPISGKIVHLAMEHGDRVEKGQELLFIEDLDTQLKVDQLSVKIGSFNQRLSILEEHLSKSLTFKERAEYLNDRIRIQYELGKAKIERDLLLSENRSPRKSPIFAPLTGQVLTFDAKEKLLGKTVKPGDPLLRLAWTKGSWEVELFIPEREAGQVREAIFRSGAEELDVDLLLTSQPTRVYRRKIGPDSLGGETTVRNDKIVLPARVGYEVPKASNPGPKSFLFLFGLASFVYRCFVVGSMMYLFHQFMKEHRLEWLGLSLVLLAIVTLFAWHIYRLCQSLGQLRKVSPMNPLRFWLCLALVAGILAVFFLRPFTINVSGVGLVQVESGHQQFLLVPASGGFLVQTFAKDGQHVRKGDILAVLRKPRQGLLRLSGEHCGVVREYTYAVGSVRWRRNSP